MKGLSVLVFSMFVLLIVSLLLIPAFMIFNSPPVYSSQGKFAQSPYVQLQQQQINQVFRGNPNIYYNSSSNPSLEFIFGSVATPFNITQIYYYNGSLWVPILKQSFLVVGFTSSIPLPKEVANKPLLIVSSGANFFFLNPNTSVTTVTISGPAGKIPIYITAFVINGSKLLPLTLAGTFQGSMSFLTPQIFNVNPGTYSISIKNGSTIFLSDYGLTATFDSWNVLGYGQIDNPDSLTTSITATGPVVVTAIYKANVQTYTVTIKTNFPLTTIKDKGGLTLTPISETIPIYVDNKLYYLGSNGLTLNLTYGYHVIQFPTYYNATFDYKKGEFFMPAGQINCYKFEELSSNTSRITVINDNTIFVNGSGTVYGNYTLVSTYYLVVTKNNFYLPSGVTLVSNTTPVIGNIAGKILQVAVSGTNQVLNLGPTKNYVPEKRYFKAGTNLNIKLVYIRAIENEKFVLKVRGVTQTYYGLLGDYSTSTVTVTTPTSTYTPYPSGSKQIVVNSPLIITVSQMWGYGARSA